MSLPNKTKPIFIVYYLFMKSPSDELRVLNWASLDEDAKIPFRFAAQIESTSIEEFLANELQVKVKIESKIKPVIKMPSEYEDITCYHNLDFQIKNVAVRHTYMYENDLGIFYAVTALTNNVFISKVGKAKGSVVYNLETIEQSGSDKPNFEEQKQQLLDFFKENESELRLAYKQFQTRNLVKEIVYVPKKF